MKAPESFLASIVEAADRIAALLTGYDKARFDRDERTQLAIIKLLEIIGEACLHLEEDFRKSNLQIPWKKIIGMRNRLAHAYWDIDLDIVWKTVTVRIPELREQLLPLVGG